MTKPTPTKPLRLRVGGYYRRRDGEIVGPARSNGHDTYQWAVGDGAYTGHGNFFASGTQDGWDLIAEVPAPGKRKARKRRISRADLIRALALTKKQYGKAIADLAKWDKANALPAPKGKTK